MSFKELGGKGDKKIMRGGRTKFHKKIKESSKRYLLRQAKDPYTKQAHKDGYRSRAAYKIIEMNEKYDFLKAGISIVDLGAAPGGWTQVISQKIGERGQIFALDKLPMDSLAGVDIMEGDFTEQEVCNELLSKCPNKLDVVVSDMAPETTGSANSDHLKSMMLNELAADFAIKMLKKGGLFACKIFQGGEEPAFRDMLKNHFSKVDFFKPGASRKDSKEIFLVASGFKG